jgi:hypothetical protein
MLSINAYFQRLNEISVADLFETIGTYVLWDSQAKVRPSYIGEGDLLSRLSSHYMKFAKPLNGYVAVLGDWSRKYYKTDGEVVEAVLLVISKRIGCYPLHNRQRGSTTAIDKAFRYDRVVKVRVGGFDPFNAPLNAKPLRGTLDIRLSTAKGEILIDHPWSETDTWKKRFS